jgi:hypothetical protein
MNSALIRLPSIASSSWRRRPVPIAGLVDSLLDPRQETWDLPPLPQSHAADANGSADCHIRIQILHLRGSRLEPRNCIGSYRAVRPATVQRRIGLRLVCVCEAGELRGRRSGRRAPSGERLARQVSRRCKLVANDSPKNGAPGRIRTRSRRTARPSRRELETSGGRHSPKVSGAPGRIRTFDPRLRRPVLYPPELRARGNHGSRASRQPHSPGPPQPGVKSALNCTKSASPRRPFMSTGSVRVLLVHDL